MERARLPIGAKNGSAAYNRATYKHDISRFIMNVGSQFQG